MRIPALLTVAALCLLAQPVDIHKRIEALEYASHDADDVAGVVAELRVEVAGLKGAIEAGEWWLKALCGALAAKVASDLYAGRKS